METKELNSKQIIRNFQLYILSDIKLEEPYLSIYNDLENCFKDLNIYISDDEYRSTYIYYGKSKTDLYIRYDKKNGDIRLDDKNVWSLFETKYNLSHETIQEITTWSVANTLHLKGTTNCFLRSSLLNHVANTLHLKGTTNRKRPNYIGHRVVNSLHLK